MTKLPHFDQKKYHHGDLRRVLIDTAFAALTETGGWQFTLRDIARRAEVSHTAPYRHFAGKGALLQELALIGFDRLASALTSATAGSTGPREGLEALAHAYLAFGTKNPDLYRLMFIAELDNAAEVHLSERARAPFAIVLGMLEQGQREGAVRLQPALGQATACWAHIHGLTMLAIDGRLHREKVGDTAIGDALDTLLCGLLRQA